MTKSPVHITIGEDKTDGLRSINTNTLTNERCMAIQNGLKNSNTACRSVCHMCYSYKSLNTYKRLMTPSLQRNTELLSGRILDYSELPVLNDAIFRYQAHGELINYNHLENLLNIARVNPHVRFGLWTKRKEMIQDYTGKIPRNVVLIYSNPTVDSVMTTPPVGFHKVFNAVTGKYMAENKMKVNCNGQCVTCRKCYLGNTKTIIEHLKNPFGGFKVFTFDGEGKPINVKKVK